MESKYTKVPVASHGLHNHRYNYPFLTSINFGDVMPCYYNTIRKGESDSPSAGVFSQLMPIAHNAFATGRYQFKAIFVPYKFVWRPWYSFDQQTEYISEGNPSTPKRYPFIPNDTLQNAFLSSWCTVVTHTPGQDDYDIVLFGAGTPPVYTYYKVSTIGRRILRILGALGSMPSWLDKDSTPLNILPILCYLKAFFDYYFPNQYVGSTSSRMLTYFAERDTIDFTGDVTSLMVALEVASQNFYESCIFDSAWENPSTPNVTSLTPDVTIKDVTNDALGAVQAVTNDNNVQFPASASVKPTNKTPFVGAVSNGGSGVTGIYAATSVLTQYVLKGLESVSNFAKRHQLTGARLLDRFLVSRGMTLQNDSARISYLIGKQDVEIDVSAIANTSDTNLGELAGRGIASTGDKPLSFKCQPDDDGILFVIVSPIPDASYPVFNDGFVLRKDYMDNYHAEFDKLGPAAVPARVMMQQYDGSLHQTAASQTFGFLNRYWDEVQERPRLLGDFMLPSQGAVGLSAYHTFRVLNTGLPSMSYQFIRMSDAVQYQRLFYSSEQENLMLFMRWRGSQMKEKLPLGDSFDWSDDELNRHVSVVVAGSQK